MMHVDWQITAAVGCFFLGLMLIWLWRERKDEAPPDRYVFKAYVTYLIYLKKLEDCKWYQWRKRREIERWKRDLIKKSKES
jgi:hypothetical protein